ncbi:MAG: hypothetical protein FWF15_10315 [Oscillospiraceae bacterium]|nr:hypothetical protein [Oscillospiraceae bacterium]
METIIKGRYTLKIDRERIAEARERVTRYYSKQKVDRLPFMYHASVGDIPNYNQREILEDTDKLIEQNIARINAQTEAFADTDFLPYLDLAFLGQGFIPSMFGAEQYTVEYAPPFIKGRLMKNIYELDKIPTRINPETDGWGPNMKDICEKFLDATNCEIPVAVSDHQSPYGIATKIIENEELMMAMYDEPELVHKLFDIVTTGIEDTIDAMLKWFGKENVVTNVSVPVPEQNGLIIWDDYISVITPELHMEFCQPYNRRLYDKYGRGHLHTCGPYFPGYIDACLACNPVSMDITIMRGMARYKDDLLEFRRVTKEAGVILKGSPIYTTSESVCSGTWERLSDEELHYMADGGLFCIDGGVKEDGAERTKHWHKLTRDLVNVWD